MKDWFDNKGATILINPGQHKLMPQPIAPDFLSGKPALPLSEGEIHLWFCQLDDSLKATLNEYRSAVAAAVHQLLSVYIGCAVEDLHIHSDKYGKPFIKSTAELEFNVSHSDNGLVIALARGIKLGVDIEHIGKPRAVLRLAARFFCKSEYHALAKLPACEQQKSFLRLWTCKEAILKALGRGLAFGLDRVEFEMTADYSYRLINIAIEGGRTADWQILGFSPATDYCGTLAWYGSPLRVRTYRLTL